MPNIDPKAKGAKEMVKDYLAAWGLGNLGTWAWNRLLHTGSFDLVLLDMRQRPEYKQRFPAMEELRKQGHAMSEADYINYEVQAKNVMHAAGLPAWFYDKPDDFGRLLAAGKSIDEINSDLQDGYLKVATAPPEVRQAFASYFGVEGDAHLAAYFIDPAHATPKLLQQAQAAEFGGFGLEQGFNVNKSLAERAAQLQLSTGQMQQGFEQLRQRQRLFDATITENPDLTASQQGVEAQFFGGDAATAVDQRIKERVAAFGGATTGSIQGQGAFTGLGGSGSASP